MKNKIYFIVFITFMVFALNFPVLSQEKQERIVEKVTVTNIEVPVRVLYKGEPITGLTRDDFEIFENKKKMKIHGFFIKRKKIKLIETKEIEEVEKKKKVPLRTFVLVFSITDFNKNVKDAIDYVFEKILRKNDSLLIFANDKTLRYTTLEDKQKIKLQLLDNLNEESKKARMRLIQYINKIETYLNMHDFRVKLTKIDEPAVRLIGFLNKYLITWNDYKKRYLTPRIDRFYFFSRFLENIKSEKWVLNFYQFDLFPKIRMGSRTMFILRQRAQELTESGTATNVAMGRRLETLLSQLYVDLNVPAGFPTEDISKLFYKVDATFHSFFIRSTQRRMMNDLEYQEFSSDIERVLKGITDVTGGENITSNNLVKSLEIVQELEDVYYMLTYVPLDPEGAPGKIKVKVKNKKYKVLYDDNFRADYINDYMKKLEDRMQVPTLKIKDFSFKRKILSFIVVDFLMREIEKKKTGRIKVRIKLTDANNNSLFDQANLLTAQKKEMKISLGAFKNIKKGAYNFLIDAVDMLTGKEANFHKNVMVK